MRASVLRSSIIGVMALGLGFMAGCGGSSSTSTSPNLEAETKPTAKQLTNASMAWLAYAGENIDVDPNPAPGTKPQILTANSTTLFRIANVINKLMPTYPNVSANGGWKVVWGPALVTSDSIKDYKVFKSQANLTFVAQSASDPGSYVVATRGTVGTNLWEADNEDVKVDFLEWPMAAVTAPLPYVSTATANALGRVLKALPPLVTPAGYSSLPGAGQSLTAFLTTLTAGKAKGSVNISFTGHSLGGAISPALALWFTQAQGSAVITTAPATIGVDPPTGWDVNSAAVISCVSFAGATPGDKTFTKYFDTTVGSYERVYNSNDVVPRGFADLENVQRIYSSTTSHARMPAGMVKLLDAVIVNVAATSVKKSTIYTPLTTYNLTSDKKFTFPLGQYAAAPFGAYTSYTRQLGYQHSDAYMTRFGLTDVNLPVTP